MSRVFVSGAGGYIGIMTVRELLFRGHTVFGFDRYFFGIKRMNIFESNRNFYLVVGDTRTIKRDALKDIDAVIDLAGLSNDASAEIDSDLTREINLHGGMRLAETAKNCGVRRYVYSSSASVYGAGGKLTLTEDDRIDPLTAYAHSKAQVEGFLRHLNDATFETVILRNATAFGIAPRMRFDLAINIMALRAWREGVIYVMGGGEQWRPFCHVEDIARSLVDAVEAPTDIVSGKTFNVGSCNYRIRDIAAMVSSIIPGRIHQIPDDPDKRSYNIDFSRHRAAFGEKPWITPLTAIGDIRSALESGLLRDDPSCYTLGWYRSVIEWDRRIKELTLDGKVI